MFGGNVCGNGIQNPRPWPCILHAVATPPETGFTIRYAKWSAVEKSVAARAVNNYGPESAPEYDFHNLAIPAPAPGLFPGGSGTILELAPLLMLVPKLVPIPLCLMLKDLKMLKFDSFLSE